MLPFRPASIIGRICPEAVIQHGVKECPSREGGLPTFAPDFLRKLSDCSASAAPPSGKGEPNPLALPPCARDNKKAAFQIRSVWHD